MIVNILFVKDGVSEQAVANVELGPQAMMTCFCIVLPRLAGHVGRLTFKASTSVHLRRLQEYVFNAREDISYSSNIIPLHIQMFF